MYLGCIIREEMSCHLDNLPHPDLPPSSGPCSLLMDDRKPRTKALWMKGKPL